jgi:hypothetical protein
VTTGAPFSQLRNGLTRMQASDPRGRVAQAARIFTPDRAKR